MNPDVETVLRIRKEQGWDDDTLLSYYELFVETRGLAPAFARYIEGVQRGEQAVHKESQ